MLNIVVLVSGGGTNLQAIMDKIADGTVTNTKIAAVISNNANATVTTANGKIIVTTTDDARVEAYSTNGTMLGTTYGNGQISLDAPAGIAIVKVVTGNDVTVTKVLVK